MFNSFIFCYCVLFILISSSISSYNLLFLFTSSSISLRRKLVLLLSWSKSYNNLSYLSFNSSASKLFLLDRLPASINCASKLLTLNANSSFNFVYESFSSDKLLSESIIWLFLISVLIKVFSLSIYICFLYLLNSFSILALSHSHS